MSVRSLNKVMLIGNLTRDPQLRFTPSGTAVCTFGVATNRSWVTSDSSERQEETEFHNIVSWAKLAEICGQLLHKGDKVYVDGRIRTRDWKTQEGDDRRTTEIVIDNMMLLSSSGGYRSSNANSSNNSSTNDDSGDYDDDTSDVSEEEEKPAKKKTTKKSTKKSKKEAEDMDDVTDDIPF